MKYILKKHKNSLPTVFSIGIRFIGLIISIMVMLALSSVITNKAQADIANTNDLEVVSKTVSNPSPSIGTTITYTVVVRNNGTTPTQAVSVLDHLPTELTFVSSTANKGSYYPSTGTWLVGTLPAGTSETLTITATVNAGMAAQVITKTATIFATGNTDLNPGNNTAKVTVSIAVPTAFDG